MSLAMNVAVAIVSASVPGTGPRPIAATNMTAKINSGIPRMKRSSPRVNVTTKRRMMMLRAVKIPRGIAMRSPSAVATKPIAIVSSIPLINSERAVVKSGGKSRPILSTRSSPSLYAESSGISIVANAMIINSKYVPPTVARNNLS